MKYFFPQLSAINGMINDLHSTLETVDQNEIDLKTLQSTEKNMLKLIKSICEIKEK